MGLNIIKAIYDDMTEDDMMELRVRIFINGQAREPRYFVLVGNKEPIPETDWTPNDPTIRQT